MNGNIQTASRYGNGSKMDNLTYLYTSNTNKLQQVSDQGPGINNSNYADDIDDQAETDNYGYYENGDLKWDKAEEIDSIEWNAFGKVKSITRSSSSTRSDLEFKYDAGGLRICKIVKPRTGSGIKNEEDWLYTYYTRDAQGNVMAVYDRKLTLESGTVKDRYTLKEHHIYGSSRLGVEQKDVNLGGIDFSYTGYTSNAFTRAGSGTVIAGDAIPQPSRVVNDKAYELSNHLGNVMVVVSDKKIGVDADTAGTEKQAESYSAEVISSQDYYAFGAMMPGRKFNETAYRYGMNAGSEKDDEIYGSGNAYTAEYWEYDARLGRRWNVDPVVKPWESSYAAFGDNPVYYNDPLGLEGEGDDKRNPKPTKAPPSGPQEGDVWNYKADDHTSQYIWKGDKWEGSGMHYGDLDEVEVFSESRATIDKRAAEMYAQQLSERKTWYSKYSLMANHLNESWQRHPPLATRVIADMIPLTSVYNAGNGIFGNGKDIYGNDQSNLGIGLNAVFAVAPFASELKFVAAGTEIGNASKTGNNLWKVGAYNELQGLEAGLQAHHVGQKSLMSRLVPGYNPANAPSILIPEIGHVTNMPGIGRVAATRGLGGFINARQVLARDIFELRRVYGSQGIPNSSLQQLIQMNKIMYPGAFIK